MSETFDKRYEKYLQMSDDDVAVLSQQGDGEALEYLLDKAGVEEKDIKLQQNMEKKGLLSKLFSLEVDNSFVNVLADYLSGKSLSSR